LPEPADSGLLYARIWETPIPWAQYAPVDAAVLPSPARQRSTFAA